MHEIKNILIAVSIWVIIIPVITGSWLIKRMSRDSLIVFLLVILATPPQLITSFVALRTKTLNVFYNVYTPCEFIFLFWLFYNKYKSKTNNLVFRTTGFLYLIVSVVIILKFSITKTFLNEWTSVNNVFYILWVLLYVSEVFYFDKDEMSLNNPFLFYMLGVFIYAQCSVLLFALYYYISQNITLGETWMLQSIGNIIMYILFTFGFFINKKSSSQ